MKPDSRASGSGVHFSTHYSNFNAMPDQVDGNIESVRQGEKRRILVSLAFALSSLLLLSMINGT